MDLPAALPVVDVLGVPVMAFDETLKELREFGESERERERQRTELLITVKHIKSCLTDDQIRTWNLVETLICKMAGTTWPTDADSVREKLREMQGMS